MKVRVNHSQSDVQSLCYCDVQALFLHFAVFTESVKSVLIAAVSVTLPILDMCMISY